MNVTDPVLKNAGPLPGSIVALELVTAPVKVPLPPRIAPGDTVAVGDPDVKPLIRNVPADTIVGPM